ncbi:MAG: hypothetical protein ISS93_00095 [Candidatus Aenigmarchaeota archaeon]|nr:hypothetical protein [Candidatus Aenigmarchaeota archaeon]
MSSVYATNLSMRRMMVIPALRERQLHVGGLRVLFNKQPTDVRYIMFYPRRSYAVLPYNLGGMLMYGRNSTLYIPESRDGGVSDIFIVGGYCGHKFAVRLSGSDLYRTFIEKGADALFHSLFPEAIQDFEKLCGGRQICIHMHGLLSVPIPHFKWDRVDLSPITGRSTSLGEPKHVTDDASIFGLGIKLTGESLIYNQDHEGIVCLFKGSVNIEGMEFSLGNRIHALSMMKHLSNSNQPLIDCSGFPKKKSPEPPARDQEQDQDGEQDPDAVAEQPEAAVVAEG